MLKTREHITRYNAAKHLCIAIAACNEEDAVPILEAALSDLSAGWPDAPFLSLKAEASHWADMASMRELKLYLVACFNRLPPQEQLAFLRFAEGAARHE